MSGKCYNIKTNTTALYSVVTPITVIVKNLKFELENKLDGKIKIYHLYYDFFLKKLFNFSQNWIKWPRVYIQAHFYS